MMVLFYLIQAYGSNPGLFALPLTIYLKESLKLSPAQLATFSSVNFYSLVNKTTLRNHWGYCCDIWLSVQKLFFHLLYASVCCLFRIKRLSILHDFTADERDDFSQYMYSL